MSIPGAASPLFIGAAAEEGAFQIDRSLRFNSADSAHLNRTPASAGTSRTTWTVSFWAKRAALGATQWLFFSSDLTANTSAAYFTASDTLEFYEFQSGSYVSRLITTQVFRDPSAWYSFVFVWDTSSGTSTDRVRIYVNGVRVDTFSTSSYPSSGVQSRWNNNVEHYFARGVGSEYFSGYLADVHFIDGQALAASDFGEYDDNNNWNPKAYSGSYGTNGFHLDFSDNSTAAALGTDTSGNSNTWTVNNISVAAGAGNDSLVDSPTNGTQTDTGAGGEVVGNYATFNALALNGNTLSNGNLDYLAGSANKPTLTTIGIPNTGKWYFEFTDVNSTGSFTAGVGTASVGVSSYLGIDANGWGYQTHPTNAGYHNSGVFTTTGRINGAGGNTIVGIAIDRDAQKIWFSVNGTFVNSGVPASGTNAQYSNLPTSGELFPGASTGSSQSIVYNAGQRPFAYTAPSGFKALCTTNLPDPTIADGSTAFDVKTYTGTGSANAQTGLNFSPDFLWIKRRNGANAHALFDQIRGVTKVLESSNNGVEKTNDPAIASFDANGFTVNGTYNQTNASGQSYVGWAWDAGTSTVTNNDGSIASSVRANQSAGFSIVTYSGNSTSGATIGHGLNAAPEFVVVKARNTTQGWCVYHSALGATKYLQLDTASGASTYSGTWNNTAPTSSVFTVGNDNIVNTGYNYVAYCFAPVDGYSSFGSYTGNGSADGPFVFAGHRSRWLMVKRTDTSGYPWVIVDALRDGYNVTYKWLEPNSSSAEQSTQPVADVDFLSNGFKMRGAGNTTNQSAGTYIYAAFAENPFKTARAR